MIGASIFSIFGLGAAIAGKDLPEAFILSGICALAVAYSYAKLGGKIVSNAGPIAFIIKAFGDTLLAGTLSILIWLTYVISIAMFLSGFAGYFIPLFHISNTELHRDIVETCLIFVFVLLHLLGTKAVGKAELYIVLIKVGILLFFICVGMLFMHGKNVIPDADVHALDGMLSASVLFFLSYMGFGLITNSSEEMRDPAKNVPRAIYISIGFVMLIYVSISFVTIGNLPIARIIEVKENALAEAAKPFLGNFGFLLISIGALFSISSALNGTIFGGANIAYTLAKDGELPAFFERKLWFKSSEGLYITTGLGLIFALLFNIGSIAAITSTIYTVIYICVLSAHIKLIKTYGGNKFLVIINILVLCIVFAALLRYQWQHERTALYASVCIFPAAFFTEFIYRKISKRKMRT